MQEQRSFLPTEVRPVNIEPITNMRPSNRDLARGINQVHNCFEAHKKDTAQNLRVMQRDIGKLNAALGLDGSRKKPAGLSSQRGAFFRTLGATTASIGGVAVIWKLLAIAMPGLALLFKILNDAILTGKL